MRAIFLLFMLQFSVFTAVSMDFPVECRTGKVLNAELRSSSASGTGLINLNKYDPAFNFDGDSYAVVTIKLDPNDTISIYDYALKEGSTTYNCIAIKEGNGSFNAAKWKYEKPSKDRIYSLIFKVNKSRFGVTSFALHYRITHTFKDVKLDFKNLGNSAFTPVSNVKNLAKDTVHKIEKPIVSALAKKSTQGNITVRKTKNKPQKPDMSKFNDLLSSAIKKDNNVYLLARDAKITGTQLKCENGDNLGCWSLKDDKAQWTFKPKVKGQHEVWINYSCDPGSYGSITSVKIGDKSFNKKLKKTNNWNHYIEEKIGNVKLTAGTSIKCTVSYAEKKSANLINLKYIKLIPSPK